MTRVGFGLEGIALQVGSAFARIEPQLSPGAVIAYFGQLGTTFPDALIANSGVQSALTTARTAAQLAGAAAASLRSAIDTNEDGTVVLGLAIASAAASAAALTSLGVIADALEDNAAALGLPQAQVTEFATNIARRILDYELVTWLEQNAVILTSILTALGVVERSLDLGDLADPSKPPFFRRALNLGLLVQAVTDPLGTLKARFGIGSATFGDPSAPDLVNGRGLLDALAGALRLQVPYAQLAPRTGIPELDADFAHLAIDSSSLPGKLTASLNVELPDGTLFDTALSSIWSVHVKNSGTWPFGLEFSFDPSSGTVHVEPSGGPFAAELGVGLSLQPAAGAPIVLFGQPAGTRIELTGAALDFFLQFSANQGQAGVRLSTVGGQFVLDLGGADGLLKTLLSSGRIEAPFDVAASYTPSDGLRFDVGSTLKVALPIHASFAGIELTGLGIAIPLTSGASTIPVALTVDLKAQLGPFGLVVQGSGVTLDLDFDAPDPNLGIVDVSLGFALPTGIGVSIDGGGISGGGFLSHDPSTGRYAGALELKVFVVSVKAFGILDTRFPDGTEGVSFVVVIIAEFTPIQLGFGFTLVGIGGMLAVNRTIDENALSDAVRTGSLENLLFPRNPVQDAPTIINDLGTVFPAARDHQIFGPMAKFGWGTPTLISADLGIILEFPGPRIALLGILRMQLPNPDFALVSLQMAVAGLFDFPAGKMEIDASLFDSYVVGYVVSGDMAYRLQTGNSSAFLLSIGGYNTGFQAPTQFPALRRASIDLGVNGNPSLTATAYFAITSNTVQFGGAIDLNAHGYGIHLSGHLGVDVLFQFSPLHFVASFSASVHVDFHGFGIGVSLHGSISGPSPWHLDAKACVSVAFWDACLPVQITFGNDTPASLPQLDPWDGTPVEQRVDPRIDVIGLGEAVADARNWAGEAPPEGFAAVSLAAAATADRTPIDPMGAVSLRQKVCPLKQVLERFGEYAPSGHTRFEVTSVVFNSEVTLVNTDTDQQFADRSERFAPAHFLNLSDAKRLSMPSYEDMFAGVSIAPNRVAAGPSGTATLEYETVFINAEGERVQEPADGRFTLTDAVLKALLVGGATARGGLRRAGARKYVVPGRAPLLSLAPPTFVVANACSLAPASDLTPKPVSRTQALLALNARALTDPTAANALTIIPFVSAA